MDMQRTATAAPPVQLVVFTLAAETYGVPIQLVKEIIRMPAVTQLPNAPAYVLGVINLRGQIIPILCLRQRFRLPAGGAQETKIVIVEFAGLMVGLEVNEVSEVLTLAADKISPPPAMATTIDSSFIAGVGKLPDRLLIVLDVERILSDEETSLLHETALAA